ncbi:MAG TPA: MBG domain-containing protein, partial [Bacteroidia bacterium]|nr:MBG domain-containing protein [Bacteroidia bacterium]
TLNQGVTGTATGDAVVLSTTANFINNAGATAVQATHASGRWLVYSNAPATNTFGNLASGQGALHGRTINSHAPGTISQTGNRYLFATTPSLTVQATLIDTKTYGDTYTFPALVEGTHYTVTGFVNAATYGNVFTQDDASTIGLSGAPLLDSLGAAAGATVGGSPYTVTITQGTLANTAGYNFGTFTSGGGITVTQRAITLTADAATKTYGDSDPALGVSLATGSTLATGDTLADVTGTVGRQSGNTVGVYDIQLGTGSKAGNYAITFDADNDAFTITPKTINLNGVAANGKTYDGTTTATFDLSGASLNGVLVGDMVQIGTGSGTFASKDAGIGIAVTANGFTLVGTDAGNYSLAAQPTGLSADITPKALTVTANDANRAQDQGNPVFSATYSGFVPGEGPSHLSGTLVFSTVSGYVPVG